MGDHDIVVMLTRPTRLAGRAAELDAIDSGDRVTSQSIAERLAHTTFLIDLPGDEVLAVPGGGGRYLSRGDSDDDLRRDALAAAGAWSREYQRRDRRTRAADWLMGYVDELSEATTERDVCNALAACASRVIDMFAVIAYALAQGEDGVRLEPHRQTVGDIAVPVLSAAVLSGISATLVLTALEMRAGDSCHALLAPVAEAFNARQIVCAPVASGVLLLLIERRRSRLLAADERDALGWFARQAGRKLAIIRSAAPAPNRLHRLP